MKRSPFIVVLLWTLLFSSWPEAALAGPPCYPPSRFIVSATEVVDGKTGLTWQRGVAPVAKTWSDAKLYCPSVGSNFRLPTVKELLTIVDYTRFSPAIDVNVFTGTTAANYWTSSPAVADQPEYAWVVSFTTGGTRDYPISNAYPVRCVR